jgi:hypothetical protein
VNFIYAKTDLIPERIQQNVNQEYQAVQEAEWKIKEDEAEEKVKRFTAKEFPEFYQRKFLDPYEEGSELRDENEALLEEMQMLTARHIVKASGLKTRSFW